MPVLTREAAKDLGDVAGGERAKWRDGDTHNASLSSKHGCLHRSPTRQRPVCASSRIGAANRRESPLTWWLSRWIATKNSPGRCKGGRSCQGSGPQMTCLALTRARAARVNSKLLWRGARSCDDARVCVLTAQRAWIHSARWAVFDECLVAQPLDCCC